MRSLAFAMAFLASVGAAEAAPYDGSTPIKCSIQRVMICSDPSLCVMGTAATAQLPAVVTVDVPGKLISGDAAGRTVGIASVRHGGGRLLLHGEEVAQLGNAWNIVIEEEAGAMTGAVLTRAGGFLMFGVCGSH